MTAMERFDTLLGKADEAADRAHEMIPNTTGSERGKLHAALAAVWLEMARLDYQRFVADQLTRKVERLTERIAVIEARRGIVDYEPMPDPFEDVPLVLRREPDPGDEGFDRPGIRSVERDIPTGGI